MQGNTPPCFGVVSRVQVCCFTVPRNQLVADNGKNKRVAKRNDLFLISFNGLINTYALGFQNFQQVQ